MTERPITLDEWHRLYQAAIRIKEIAPWEWMEETDVFGVRDPETGELGFVSIMGQLGEHLALTVYLGSEALYSFWSLQDEVFSASPEAILEIPQIQASFEDREYLTDQDRRLIKDLGLKFPRPAGLASVPEFPSGVLSLVPGTTGSSFPDLCFGTGHRCRSAVRRRT